MKKIYLSKQEQKKDMMTFSLYGAVKQIESKRLKSIKKYKKIKNKHQMVIERISRDCRKFGMIFPSPFSYNGKLNIH